VLNITPEKSSEPIMNAKAPIRRSTTLQSKQGKRYEDQIEVRNAPVRRSTDKDLSFKKQPQRKISTDVMSNLSKQPATP